MQLVVGSVIIVCAVLVVGSVDSPFDDLRWLGAFAMMLVGLVLLVRDHVLWRRTTDAQKRRMSSMNRKWREMLDAELRKHDERRR